MSASGMDAGRQMPRRSAARSVWGMDAGRQLPRHAGRSARLRFRLGYGWRTTPTIERATVVVMSGRCGLLIDCRRAVVMMSGR